MPFVPVYLFISPRRVQNYFSYYFKVTQRNKRVSLYIIIKYMTFNLKPPFFYSVEKENLFLVTFRIKLLFIEEKNRTPPQVSTGRPLTRLVCFFDIHLNDR